MKITGTDFTDLQSAILDTMMDIGAPKLAAYRKALETDNRVKDVNKRYRWDILFAVPSSRRNPIMNRLYAYANDEHIDTALRAIVKS